MDIQATLEKIEERLSPALEHLGYTLIEREIVHEAGRFVLRLYIDKEGGVTIDDCERASHGVEDLIEVEELIPSSYSLEVSSPGINRPLRRRDDFQRFSGSKIKLRTREQIDGRANYKGTLEGVDGDDILMEVDGSHYRIPFQMLLKAKVEEETGSGKVSGH